MSGRTLLTELVVVALPRDERIFFANDAADKGDSVLCPMRNARLPEPMPGDPDRTVFSRSFDLEARRPQIGDRVVCEVERGGRGKWRAVAWTYRDDWDSVQATQLLTHLFVVSISGTHTFFFANTEDDTGDSVLCPMGNARFPERTSDGPDGIAFSGEVDYDIEDPGVGDRVVCEVERTERGLRAVAWTYWEYWEEVLSGD